MNPRRDSILTAKYGSVGTITVPIAHKKIMTTGVAVTFVPTQYSTYFETFQSGHREDLGQTRRNHALVGVVNQSGCSL